MSLKLDGTGKITGIDQGLSVVGVTTLHNELSVSGDVVVGGGLTVTGVLTYEDVTNVDSIGIITARSGIVGDLTGNVTGDITGNIIGSPTLSGISSSISDTAIDIFVYDTSKDSDGGAWRKRTQHTSWYNETLNTATRGSRREFPAVAVIVVETGQVTIYDGDDPDLPMWMVFNGTAGGASHNLLVDTGTFCLSALNGTVFMGALAIYVNFISEYSRGHRSSGGSLYWNGPYKGNIAERNAGKGSTKLGDKLVLGGTHDVAMTVLPNAPVDVATGLPVPTIAVATGSGYSIIKDDGTVVDGISSQSNHNKVEKITFTDNNQVAYVGFDFNTQERGRFLRVDNLISADTTITTNADQSQNSNALYGNSGGGITGDVLKLNIPTTNYIGESFIESKDGNIMFGNVQNLFLINENVDSPSRGMHAGIATDFNTGWMHGDIKGAFLSDTDATNVTGGNIVTNGDAWTGAQSSTSSTPPNGWTGGNAAQWRTSTGGDGSYVRLVNAGSSQGGPNSYMYQAITTVPGRKYKISLTQYHHATISVYYSVGTSINGGDLVTNTWVSSSSNTPRNETSTFTATGTTTYLTLGITSGTNNYDTGWDNVVITEVVDDRSVNANGLHSYGTINKSAVATGAELVAYHGFNTSNYLRHTNTINYGNAATITMGGWSKIPGSSVDSNYRYLCSCRSGSIQIGLAIHIDNGSATSGKPYFYDVTNSSLNSDGPRVDDNQWHHIIGVLDGGSKKIYIDGELITSANVTGINLSAVDITNIGHYVASSGTNVEYSHGGYLALIKFSGSAPTAEQVKKMYEDEKFLFQENAKATLYGSSDAVTGLAYDEVTERLYVGTSSGRSDFQGLRRINNTTTAVTTAISAHDEFIIEQ